MELGQQRASVEKTGRKVVAVSYDSDAVWKNFLTRKGLNFPYIADVDSKVIDAFGLRNRAVNVDFMQGIPHPGVFLLDGQGRVEAKYFEEDYRERVTIASVLGTKVTGQRFEGKRIVVTTSASTGVVKGGQKITLTLTGTLGKGLHVYAPGAPEDFIPVTWTMENVKATDPKWPAPTKLFQYGGTFSATREITLPPQLKNEELVIKGTFRYQSCTSKVCYPPEIVPIEWKFLSESHDRERVPVELRRK